STALSSTARKGSRAASCSSPSARRSERRCGPSRPAPAVRRSASVTAETLGERAAAGGPSGPLAARVHASEGPLHVAHAEEAERLRLPERGAVADDRQAGQGSRAPRDEIGERAAGEVGGADAVPRVAARPGEAGPAIVIDARHPVAGHRERAAPGVREA